MHTRRVIKISFIITIMLLMVSCNKTTFSTTTTTELTGYQLPDLTNKSKTEIITFFSNLGATYSFIYQTSSLTPDNFVAYDGDLNIGDHVLVDTEIIIVLATDKLVLPNLLGKDLMAVNTALRALGITFTADIVFSNDVADRTFSHYGNGYQQGDLIDKNTSVTIFIAYNAFSLPDFSSQLKSEIEDVFRENSIDFEFSYFTDDNFEEDSFKGYGEGFEIGDLVGDDENIIIQVVLYKNTFTSDSTSLLISKYINSSNNGNDQAIELYNPTDYPISLKDYHLALFENNPYEVTTLVQFPDEIIEPQETFLIANRQSTQANLLRKADLMTNDLAFDSFFTIQLRYKNNTYIDQISQMTEEIYVRDANIKKGNRLFTLSEWDAYIPSFYAVLDSHPYIRPEKITFVFINREFSNLLGGMDLVTLTHVNDGDTANFTPGFTDGNRVRYLGVDTPETSPSVVPVPEPWGLEAKAYNETILNYAKNNGKNIYVQSDPDLGFSEGYGRFLGLIWVDLGDDILLIDILDSQGNLKYTEELTGVILINYHLVKNGFSLNYYGSKSSLTFNNRYLYRWFQDAEDFAKEMGLGLHE